MSVTKISLVQQLITNLNVILYSSTCHTVYVSVLILFMIMSQLIIDTYISLMYKLKKMERYLRVNLLGPGPRLMKKEFTGPRSHKGWETLMYGKIWMWFCANFNAWTNERTRKRPSRSGRYLKPFDLLPHREGNKKSFGTNLCFFLP